MRKKIFYMTLAFLIPILFFILAMYLRVGTIDGNYILISDMGAQYNSLFQYLKNVLEGTESLIYSFNKGLGGEMFTTFTYYLASPLNLLVIFFEPGQLPNCILLIILLKIGLSGLTMNVYFSYKNPNKQSINLLFSICYALMGYIINYYFNVMWLDAIYMLPLVILGLEKLIDMKKPLIYIISLAYTIICNYYIGYMVCIFCLIYFIYKMMTDGIKNKEIIKIFIISSLLSVGIASFILIPTIIQIPNYPLIEGEVSYNFDYILKSISGILQNAFIGTHNCTYTLNKYGTYTYIPLICFVMIILYFSNKNISRKNKVGSICVILFFILSFLLEMLIYFWHGFSLPNGFNSRQSFLLCFFLINLAYYSYNSLKEIRKNNLVILSVSIILYFILSVMLLNKDFILNIALSLIFILLYIIIIFNIKNRKKERFWYLIFIVIGLELFLNTYMSFVSKTELKLNYSEYIESICPALINSEDHRMENIVSINTLDGLTCHYKNGSIFLSTITSDDIKFYNNYGYFGYNKTLYMGVSNSNSFNSILGIKYYLLDEDQTHPTWLEKTNYCETIKLGTETKEYCIYENKNALSLGYVVDNINGNFNEFDVFQNQNILLKNMFGLSEEYWIMVDDIEKIGDNSFLINNNSQKFYLYLDINPTFKALNEMVLYSNNIEIYSEDSPSLSSRILEIDSNTNQTKIDILMNNDSKLENMLVYKINEEALSKLNEKLNNISQLKNIKVIKEYMTGEINMKDTGNLLLTIPYDSNFTLYVDGKKTQINKAYNYFMSAKVSEGKHVIKLVYQKNKYYISGIMSLLFASLTIIFVKKCKKLYKN